AAGRGGSVRSGRLRSGKLALRSGRLGARAGSSGGGVGAAFGISRSGSSRAVRWDTRGAGSPGGGGSPGLPPRPSGGGHDQGGGDGAVAQRRQPRGRDGKRRAAKGGASRAGPQTRGAEHQT